MKPTAPALRSPLLALLLVAASGAAAELKDPYSVPAAERLTVLVERMRLEQESLQTLQASFVQLKESVLLIEPEEARGTFYYAAPDKVRWEYEDPTSISLLITGDHMTTWYRDLGQVEEVEIGRHSQRILEYLGAGSSLASLLEYFDVRLSLPKDRSLPFHLELDPKFERVARRLQGMDLWVDSDTYLPVRVRYVEADGDVTDYRFADFAINHGIDAEHFEMDVPEGVQVRTIDLERRPGLH